MLGYAMGERHDAALVGASLRMAATTRGGRVDGVIFHSDRGSEHTSAAYSDLCDRLGVVQSMGRVGSCFDNAAAESFNSTIKVEFIHRHHFATRSEARIKIATGSSTSTTPEDATARPAGCRLWSSNESSARHGTTTARRTRLHNGGLYEIRGLTSTHCPASCNGLPVRPRGGFLALENSRTGLPSSCPNWVRCPCRSRPPRRR